MANNATQEYVMPNNATQEYVMLNSQATKPFGNSQELPIGFEAHNRAAGLSLTPGARVSHEAHLHKAEHGSQNLAQMSGAAPLQNFFRGVSKPRALTPAQARQILLNRLAYNAQFPSARPFLAPAPAPAPKTMSLRKKTQGFTSSWSSLFRSVGHKNPNMKNKANPNTKNKANPKKEKKERKTSRANSF